MPVVHRPGVARLRAGKRPRAKSGETGMRREKLYATLLAAGLCVGVAAKDAPVAQDPKAAEVINELGLVESATALRDARGWKAPKKIVLLQMGPLDALQAVAPGVTVVVVNDTQEMVQQVADADAIGGVDGIVCDD